MATGIAAPGPKESVVQMKLNERLDSVRQAFPACETLAYADLSSGIILSCSASAPLRQEELNALSANATNMLDGGASQHLSAMLEGPDGSDIFQVIICESTYVVILLRSTQSPFDALCCVCEPAIDIAGFIAAARVQLDQIGGEA